MLDPAHLLSGSSEFLIFYWLEENRQDVQQIQTKVQQLIDHFSMGETLVMAMNRDSPFWNRGRLLKQTCLTAMQLQMDDLEDRSCQKNLQIRGLPEVTCPKNLCDTVIAILHKVLDTNPPESLEIHQVHSTFWTESDGSKLAPRCYLRSPLYPPFPSVNSHISCDITSGAILRFTLVMVVISCS